MNKKQSKHFQNLLLQFSQETSDEGRQKIETHLWDEYGTEQAVFVLDMYSFSLFKRN
jgi:hypothetical protein